LTDYDFGLCNVFLRKKGANMRFVVSLLVLSLGAMGWAEDAPKSFKGESEASAVAISGNSNSETYGAKTTNTWSMTENDLMVVFGKYVRATSGGTESNKAWEAGLRYERVFTKDVFSGFLQHKAEHDPYNGIFVQRDSTDIGGKYFFTKSDDFTWLGELGYRHAVTYTGLNAAPDKSKDSANFARLYTEGTFKINSSTSGKLWVEYLPNLKDSDKSLMNAEASLTVSMTDILSLKTAYLVNRNEGVASPAKKETTTWTTALVAKY
jgi:putative salt-induced outer membrane protein